MANRTDSFTKQILAGTYDRNRSIKKLRADGMTYKSIGSLFGLTKQRVHRIVNNPFDNTPPKRHQPTLGQDLRGYLSKAIGGYLRHFKQLIKGLRR